MINNLFKFHNKESHYWFEIKREKYLDDILSGNKSSNKMFELISLTNRSLALVPNQGPKVRHN